MGEELVLGSTNLKDLIFCTHLSVAWPSEWLETTISLKFTLTAVDIGPHS